MQVANVCVDASVAVKWFLDDESDGPAALRLLDRLATGEICIVVPSLFYNEVANALHMALRRGRADLGVVLRAVEFLKSLNLTVIGINQTLTSCLSIAQRYEVSFYDAAYLAAAEATNATLISCDKKLLAAADRGPILTAPLSLTQ